MAGGRKAPSGREMVWAAGDSMVMVGDSEMPYARALTSAIGQHINIRLSSRVCHGRLFSAVPAFLPSQPGLCGPVGGERLTGAV